MVRTGNFGNNTERLNLISQERPIIPEAYQKLGFEKMIELKFNQTNIKRHLIQQLDAPMMKKVKEMILDKISPANHIELSKAKEIIAEIYTFLGIEKTAKATDLDYFFICKI